MKKNKLRPGDHPGIKIDDCQGVIYRQVWIAETIDNKGCLGIDPSLNELRKKVAERLINGGEGE